MNKFTGFISFVLGVVVFFSAEVCFAGTEEKVAGTKVEKESTKPFAEIEPSKNITDIISKPKGHENEDVLFSSDEIESDQKKGLITASGNVEIIYGSMTLKAQKVIYDQINDRIIATGNVKLEEANGNEVYADNVLISEHMSRAFMEKVKVKMIDGTQVYADSFRRRSNNDKVIEHAMYTPCDFCEKIAPLWQINARKVKHDAKNQNINYNDAVLKVKEIPVLYTPYLSHPDPDVKRRSGFLAPTIGSNSYLGATLEVPYFFNISENEDFTFKPILSTDKNIIWGGDYRKYFYSGEMSLSGTYLNDKAKDRKDNRGNLFAKGRYEIDDNWLFDTNLNYVSDDLYLKELSLSQKDDAWLVSDVRLQRFEDRDYASIEAYYYKLISYNLRERDKSEFNRRDNNRPFVVPFATYENISDPNSFGAYFKNDFGMASIYHEDDQSTQRVSMINSWVLPYTSPFGEKYRFVASVKSDLYYTNSYVNEHNQSYTGATSRVFPQAALEWKYPFIRAGENSSQIIEPVVIAVVAPNGDNRAKRIPNEDSQDVDLDDTNILDLDRYTGYDRNDTGSRISYGFNWSSYGDYFGRSTAFVAQSYRFNKRESFSEQMGEPGRFSDYVGRIYAAPNRYVDFNYRFRLDKDDFKMKYSELGGGFGADIFRLYVSYIYLNSNLYSSEDMKERHELYSSITSALTRDWSISIYNRQDLTKKGGSLEHGGSLTYEDECLKFVSTISKYNSNNPDLDDEYSFSFTFYLKTLGGFGA